MTILRLVKIKNDFIGTCNVKQYKRYFLFSLAYFWQLQLQTFEYSFTGLQKSQ